MSDWWSADPVANAVRPQEPDYSNAISSIESGGNYRAIGPKTRTGDRAVGKYQVMGQNVGPWTEEILGERMTPLQFAANPEAQDAVFKAKFGSYVNKYGPDGAARAWFAGEGGMNDPTRKDILGTSVADYSRKFNAATGQKVASAAPSPPQIKDWWSADPVAGETQQPGPVEQRFAETPEPANASKLRAGLIRRGTELMQGPAQSPIAQMATDFANIVPAASQRTSPHVSTYGGQLISKEAFEGDDGSILYRDPQTGEVRPTDQKTQVAIRDPVDGVVKVFARSDATNESAFTGAARVASSGMLSSAPTIKAAAPAAKVVPKASEIIATAKPSYAAFKEAASQVEIPPETASGIANRLRGALDKVNLDVEMAGKPAAAALRMLESGEPMTLDYLQRVKRVASRGFNNPEKDVRDGAAAISGEISRVISQVSPEAAASLKKADEIFATGKSVQQLQRLEDVADLRAGRAGYGGNAVNSMRQVLSPIVQRAVEGKTTGFKPNEIQAMREIVEGTTATNVLRNLGQLSPSKGIIQTVGGAGAMYAAGPAGVAVPALGMASNKIATILTGKQIDRLKELVAKRSPEYAKAVEKAVTRYEQAQADLLKSPAINKLAAYVAASRALSSGLTRDGIQVSSGDLLKSIQGPIKSAAEGDEPAIPGRPGE